MTPFGLSKMDSTNRGPSFSYYSSGKLKTKTLARTDNGRPIVNTYGYNNAGDLASLSYSDTTPQVTHLYDRRGRLSSTQDASGTVSYTYHSSGQLQDEVHDATGLMPNLKLHRDFDAYDRLSEVTPLGVDPTIIAYDSAGRVKTFSNGAMVATYGYLPNSSLVQTLNITSSGNDRSTVLKSYDFLGRLQSISTSVAGVPVRSVAYDYNDANQRISATREDSEKWGYSYDALGQLSTADKVKQDGTPINGLSFGYQYDTIGNRVSTSRGGHGSVYVSNALNQYVQRTVPGVAEVLGQADAASTVTANLIGTQRQGAWFYAELGFSNESAPYYGSVNVVGVKKGAAAGGMDAIMQEARSVFLAQNPEVFSYDEDGNLLNDGRWIYSWNAENQLIGCETNVAAATAGAPRLKLTFSYDSQGRRVRKLVSNWNGASFSVASDRRFVYDRFNMVAEYNALSAMRVERSFIWGLDLGGSMHSAGGVGGLLRVTTYQPTKGSFIPTYNGNGDVLGLVDESTGSTAAEYEYGPFGESLLAVGAAIECNPFRFSTKFVDSETGLLYYGFRYYNPQTGRFINRDPLEELSFPVLYNTQLEAAHTSWSQSKVGEEPVFLELRRTGAEYVMLNNAPLNGIEYLGLEPFKEKHCNVLNETCTDSRRVRSPDGKGYFNRCIRFVCTYQCFCPGDDQCSKFPCDEHKGGTCPFAHGVHVGPIYSTPKDTPLWARILGGGAEFAPNCHQAPIKEKAYKKFKCRGEL